MPEFEEERGSPVVAGEISVDRQPNVDIQKQVECADEAQSIAVDERGGEEDRSRCTLKRGRMPVQKKVAQKLSCISDDSIRADDVCKDAIGVRKSAPANVRKSTTIVEKNMNNSEKENKESCCCQRQGTKQSGESKGNEAECCHSECPCGGLRKFMKKILCFFGLCKKCKPQERGTRQYRHRSHNQRKSRPQSHSHSD
jgi:hypothetical protein